MKKVKFNITTTVLMIPDEQYPHYKESLEKMKYSDYKSYRERLAAGHEHPFVSVEIGQSLTVPDWYYNAHKDELLTVGNSFDKYTAKNGGRIPFDTSEAMRHGDMKTPDEFLKKVKLFELIEDIKKPGRPAANAA